MANIVCKGVTFPQIKAIFFDKDGTLEDSRFFLLQLAKERVKQVAFNAPNIEDDLLLALGIRNNVLDPQGLMAVGSREDNELAAAAYLASSGYDWFTAKNIARNAFNRAATIVSPNQEYSPLFPNSLEVIQSLVKAKVKLGIISADSTGGIQSFVERENLGSYFQVVLGSNQGLKKPNPLLYLKACKLLNVQPKHTLMVGDSVGDILMAQAANARATIGISWHNLPADHLVEATVTIDHLAAIQVV